MSGPNDDVPDFTLSPWAGTEPALLPGYQLRLHLDVPRLEWGRYRAPAPGGRSLATLDDPGGSLRAAEGFILDGSLLFGMRRPSWSTIDKAFLNAPTAPGPLLPSFAQMKAWDDESFFRNVGRPIPLFGAPLAPSDVPRLPIATPEAATPFFKLPDLTPFGLEPPAPKAGGAGDILSALYQLPIVQDGVSRINDEALRNVRKLKFAWDNGSTSDRAEAIVFVAPLAAGVLGATLGASEARHMAFKNLLGVDVPVPWVPGLSLNVNDYGRGDFWLLGTPRADPNKPSGIDFALKFDLLEAIPGLKAVF